MTTRNRVRSSRTKHQVDPFIGAVDTVFGWMILIVLSSTLSAILGLAIRNGVFDAYYLMHRVLSVWFVYWIIAPQVLVAYVCAAIAWYLPIHYESVELKSICFGANVIVWLIIFATISDR